MARKDTDISIDIDAEYDGVITAFAEIRRQAESLRAQLRPTTEALREGFEKMGNETLPSLSKKAEAATNRIHREAKKLAEEIGDLDQEIEIDADVKPAKKALDDLKRHAGRAANQIRPVTNAMRNDFARIGGAISGITGPVTGFAKLAAGVSFAGALAGAYSLKEIIDGLSERTVQIAEDISRMTLSAEAFNLDIDADPAEALKTVRALEAVFQSFQFEADDLNAIAGAFTLEAGKALKGDEGAIDLMRNLGIAKSDLQDTNGQLKSTDKLFAMLSKKVAGMSNDLGLMRLQELFGEDDGIRLFKVFSQLGENFDSTVRSYREMIDIKDEDFERSGELRDLLQKEGLAWENMNRQIFRGFVEPMSDAIVARERFAKAIGTNAEVGSAAAGEFYARTWETIADTAERILEIITKVEDGTTPLENGLERISGLIETMAQGLVDVVELIATGKTDAPWLNDLIETFENFKRKVLEVYEDLTELWGKIDDFLSFFGIDETWEQVGVIAGLIVFQGTIRSVIGTIGTMVGWIGRLTGATAALGSAATAAGGAATAAAGTVAATAKQAVKKAGPIAAAVAAGKTAVDDADYMWYSDKAHDRAKEIAAEQGDAVAAGYLKAIQDALEERHGEGLFGGRLSRWVDENLGTDLFWDKDRAELEVALTVNEANAKEAAKGAMLAFQEAGGWPVDDEGRVQIGAGWSISGAELKAGVMEGVQAQFDANPIQLTFKQLDILKGMEGIQIGVQGVAATAPQPEGSPVNATPLQPMTVIIDGKPAPQFLVPMTETERVKAALQLTARARS